MERREFGLFGRFMVFRALGWSSGSAIAGVVYQLGLRLGPLRVPGSASVVLCGLIGVRILQLLLALRIELPSGTPDGDGGGGAAGRGGLRDFLLNPEVVIFFLCMAINGVAGATYDNFVVRERVPQTCDSANGL